MKDYSQGWITSWAYEAEAQGPAAWGAPKPWKKNVSLLIKPLKQIAFLIVF